MEFFDSPTGQARNRVYRADEVLVAIEGNYDL
jgi:hypothetical protein